MKQSDKIKLIIAIAVFVLALVVIVIVMKPFGGGQPDTLSPAGSPTGTVGDETGPPPTGSHRSAPGAGG